MRLFTHNMLQCNVNSKKCPTGKKYPLQLSATQCTIDSEKRDSTAMTDGKMELPQDHHHVTPPTRRQLSKDELRFLKDTVMPRLNWPVFVATCRSLGWPVLEIPPSYAAAAAEGDHEATTTTSASECAVADGPAVIDLSDEAQWLAMLHELALLRKITQGHMTCAGCGHVFPIKDGIPNMLLNNDEA